MEARKKGKFIVVLLCLIGSVFLLLAKSSAALTLLDDRVRITGYFENTTGWHTQDALAADRGHLSICRNVFQLDTTIKLLENGQTNIILHNIFRFFYEASFALDDGVNRFPRDKMQIEQGNDKLRELYLTIQSGQWRFSLGKQQLVWGESDLFRMADIINPLDLSYNYIWAPFKDTRIPLWMLVGNYTFPGDHNYSIEVVFNPGDYHSWRLADAGGNWSLPAKRFFSMPGFLPGTFPGPLDNPFPYLSYEDTLPTVQWFLDEWRRQSHNHGLRIDDWCAGARVKGNFGPWDLGLFYYYGISGLPTFYFDMAKGGALTFRFPRQQNIGMTANVYDDFTQTVWRFESAYTTNGSLAAFQWVFPPMKEVSRDVVAFMLGFDRPTWLPSKKHHWPRQNTWFLSGQWFQKWALSDYRKKGVVIPGVLEKTTPVAALDMTNDNSQTMFTFTANTFVGQGNKYSPQFLFMYDPSGNGAFWPSFTYSPNNWFWLQIGYQMILSHNTRDGYMGLFRDNDQAYLQLKLSFY